MRTHKPVIVAVTAVFPKSCLTKRFFLLRRAMFSSRRGTTNETNELLITGYIRIHCKKDVIKDITQICQLFYTELFFNSFNLSQMNEDMEKIYGDKTFNIDGFPFKCSLSYDPEYYEYDLYICCKDIPKLKQCDIYHEVYINELKIGRKGFRRHKQFNDGINNWLMSVGRDIIDKYKKESVDQITLQFCVDILYLRYKDDINESKKDKIFEECKINKKIKYY